MGSGIDQSSCNWEQEKGPRVTAACTAPPAVEDLGELWLKGGDEEASPGRRGPRQVWEAGPALRPAPPPRGRATLPAPRPGLSARQGGPARRKAPVAAGAPGTRRGTRLAPRFWLKFGAGKLGGPGESGPGNAGIRHRGGLSLRGDEGPTRRGPAGVERALQDSGSVLSSCPFPSPSYPPRAPGPVSPSQRGLARVPAAAL